MNQSLANQLAKNEFQSNNLKKCLGQYLSKNWIKPFKFESLLTLNSSHTSPVFKVFNSLNIIFILTILALSVFGLHTWINPKYPDKIDSGNLAGTSRELAPLVIARQKQPPQSINEVVSKNLFRKERDEYIPPPSPPSNFKLAKTKKITTLPSPELNLRGVMLLNGTKIAILEGSYPVAHGDKTKKQTIKRKGYYLGDQIGNYKISQIEKKAVKLNSPSGEIFTVKLIRRAPNINKIPKKNAPKVISTRPSEKKILQPTQRISGALTAPEPRHISGR